MISMEEKRDQLLIGVLLVLNLLPLAMHVPITVFLVSLFLVGWKTALLLRDRPLPRPLWIRVAALAGCGALILTQRAWIGQEVAVPMLVFLGACKFFEARHYRDSMMLVILSFFLLMAFLLNSQGLGALFFMLLDLGFAVYVLLQLHQASATGISLRSVGRLFLVALPIWLVLFLLFPRFQVSLWERKSPTVLTGFSEDMNPGEVGRVAQSDSIAFRVRFRSDAPNPQSMYWRGAILPFTDDGLRWKKALPGLLPVEVLTPPVAEGTPEVSAPRLYDLWLEPSFRQWLFLLDLPSKIQGRAIGELGAGAPRVGGMLVRRRPGLVLEASRDLGTRAAYTAEAQEHPPQLELSAAERKAYLRLPRELEPRVLALAGQLRSPDGDPARSIVRVQDWLRLEGFRYTLQPGVLKSGKISEFLFDKKVGFCEHFSAAGALLLRAMGHPTRVVVGFQGAEKNHFGDYWIIRNQNAHAWVEVWKAQGNGQRGQWVRFDPTATIAPLRLQLGGEYFRIASELARSPEELSPELLRMQAPLLSRLAETMSLAWDSLELRWNSFLLEYDFDFQKSLMAKIGLPEVSRLSLLGGAAAGALLLVALASLWLQRSAKGTVDPLLREWRRFCRTLGRAGLARKPEEGPLEFSERAIGRFPDCAPGIRNIAAKFIEARYGRAILQGAQGRRRVGEMRNEIRALKRMLARNSVRS